MTPTNKLTLPGLVAQLAAALKRGDREAGQRLRRELEAAGLKLVNLNAPADGGKK
jgi:hypothetical protein